MSHLLSRRTFLAAAGSAGVTVLDRRHNLFAAQEPSDYVIGVQSFSLRAFDVDTAIEHAARLGFAHIEFFGKHLSPTLSEAEVRQARAKTDKAGLQLIAHGVNRFSADDAANRQIFQFAQWAGLRSLSAAPSPDAYASLEKLVAEFGIRIAIHNHGPGAEFDTIADVQEAVKGRHPFIGACVDTGHFIRSGVDPLEAIEVLGPRVHGVHLKDFSKAEKQAEETVLGKGLLDLAGTFRALRKIGFPKEGALSVEYEANKDNPFADLQACLKAAEEAVRQTRS